MALLCDGAGVFIAAGLWVGRYRVQILVVARNIFLYKTSKAALWSSHPPILWARGFFSDETATGK